MENADRFKRALHTYNWDHVLSETCPQSAYTNFSNTFNNLVDISFPESSKKFNSNMHKIEPWMTVGILTSRRNKCTLFKQQLKNPTALNRESFKKFRNLYNIVIRSAKKNFLSLPN